MSEPLVIVIKMIDDEVKKGEMIMRTSRVALAAQLQALGSKNLMGIMVPKEEVNKLLKMSQNEEDKMELRQLCDAFGLAHSE
jgi:hypothetical protein